MSKKYKLGVYVGRFQPLHLGHCSVLDEMVKHCEGILVLVGSQYAAPTPKNPFQSWYGLEGVPPRWWPSSQITDYLDTCQDIENISHVNVVNLMDRNKDKDWFDMVDEYINQSYHMFDSRQDLTLTALFGAEKDASSYYIKELMRRDDELVFHPSPLKSYNYGSEPVPMSSTDIREVYFDPNMGMAKIGWLNSMIPTNVFNALIQFSTTEQYKTLVEESDYIKKYKASWANAPYPPTFVTADMCVFTPGGKTVLTITRGNHPGKGLKALPGGFVDQKETTYQAALRELQEETGLTADLLHINPVSQVFDRPDRSLRGRTISHCYMAVLKEERYTEHVKAADDAAEVEWLEVAEMRFQPSIMFEDHYSMVNHFYNLEFGE